jgi:hypothetical protein
MKKKDFMLIGLVLVLAGVYAVFFTDWFRTKTIPISHTNRSMRAGAAASRMIFGLGNYYSLTEIKVVPLAALQTNKLAEPVWHLVSDEGSDDVDHFVYGQKINGMDPVIEGAGAEPLQPSVTYCLFVTAGKIKGQHDFQLGAPSVSPPKPQNTDN